MDLVLSAAWSANRRVQLSIYYTTFDNLPLTVTPKLMTLYDDSSFIRPNFSDQKFGKAQFNYAVAATQRRVKSFSL